jgi:hypothetical protein
MQDARLELDGIGISIGGHRCACYSNLIDALLAGRRRRGNFDAGETVTSVEVRAPISNIEQGAGRD